MSKDLSDVHRNVGRWLADHGYPLELRTAAAFRQAGFQTVQSDYYADPDSSKHREIDVVAEWVSEADGGPDVAVSFIVECKATSKPWVVFTDTKVPTYRTHLVLRRLANPHGSAWLTLIANDADAQDAALFRPPQAPGYGVREALSEREDICYAALMTSVKAASHMLRQAAGATDDMVHVVCPLVIISAPLLLCSLDEDEELELMDVEEADVHWRYPSPSGAPYTIVKIMRLSRLGDYAHECAADLRRLLRKFPDRSELESAAAIIKRSAAWTPII